MTETFLEAVCRIGTELEELGYLQQYADVIRLGQLVNIAESLNDEALKASVLAFLAGKTLETMAK